MCRDIIHPGHVFSHVRVNKSEITYHISFFINHKTIAIHFFRETDRGSKMSRVIYIIESHPPHQISHKVRKKDYTVFTITIKIKQSFIRKEINI